MRTHPGDHLLEIDQVIGVPRGRPQAVVRVEPTDAMNALRGLLPPLVSNDTAATQGPARTVVVGSAFRR
jgi:hypothetical protein